MQPETEYMTITGEMALDWLTANTHNRPSKPSVIKAFKIDILSHNVMPTHQGIAFTKKDPKSRVLVDGQNRLTALAELYEEGHHDVKLTNFPVSFYVPLSSQAVLDTGAPRTVLDQLIIEGKKATTSHRSIASAMLIGRKPLPRRDLIDFMKRYWTAIDRIDRIVHNGTHVRGVNISVVAGACCRAYVTANATDRDAIFRFLKLLIHIEPERSGIADRRGVAAELRAYLRKQAEASTAREADGRGVIYWHVIESLRDWLGYAHEVGVVQPFPLPGESW